MDLEPAGPQVTVREVHMHRYKVKKTLMTNTITPLGGTLPRRLQTELS
jgi:fructose-1-phosphate kinase PfkB-like protein